MQKSVRRELPAPLGYLAASILFVLSFIAARGFVEIEMSPALTVAVALLPVLPFILWVLALIRKIGELDELQRRIHLEALVIAYPLTMLLLMTLGLLEVGIELPAEDLSYRHVWSLLPIFYFLGLTLAKRRYE
ncbi:MAG: hypothetical protein L0332_24450 [Chloroflexi bacterium]|nr:hypothetical protein [Chloroflexota bacterium]MCI0579862.1 hypothetical protein [Chloroflexota bacterium]MCI0646143.1 hypothetical protein [Chloroflexota bacterium]MCI0729847.1 hypothetical protein [Chloroflexota bacterium]